jgi:citrate lyase subunit beta/citryl-CoA lyase
VDRLPVRTWLFAPGSEPRVLGKAAAAGADAVIADLEDAVAADEKARARDVAAAWLTDARAGGAEPWVRVNVGPQGVSAADVAAVVPGRPAGIVVPKAEDPAVIDGLADLLSELEAAHGLAAGSVAIAPLIETPAGLLRAAELAGAGRGRVPVLMLGGVDYLARLGVRGDTTGPAVRHALAVIAVAAAANDLVAVDTVFLDVADEAGLVAATRAASDLGCFGKLVIHPRQLAPVRAVFTPTEEEVVQARRIVAAYDEALSEGRAALLLDGRMIDLPVVDAARRTLLLADRPGPAS